MIKEGDNVDVVTDRRLGDLAKAEKEFRQVEAQGRLPSQLRANAQLVVPTSAPLQESGTAGATGQNPVAARPPLAEAETTSESRPASDPEAAWRSTRLAITAGLVVLLFVVWIWQKRKGR